MLSEIIRGTTKDRNLSRLVMTIILYLKWVTCWTK